jgi:hypothetical protein
VDIQTLQTDLRAIMSDGPHTITIGGVTKACIFEETDELALPEGRSIGAEQIVTASIATVVSADFPTVKGGDACTVITRNKDGSIASTVNFTVWRRLRVQDGAATELMLRKV